MTAILDANVLISAPLGWTAQRGAESAVVRAPIEGRFGLVLPRKSSGKPVRPS